VAVAVIPPMTLAMIRFLLASVLLSLLLRLCEPGAKLVKNDIPMLSLTGIIGIAAYYYFLNTGIKFTTASATSIILSVVPVLSMLADYLFFKNPLTPHKILCVLLSIAGVCLVVGANFSRPEGGVNLIGNLLMLAAALSWVAYNIFTCSLGKKRSLLYIVTYQTIFGTICLLPFSLLEMDRWQPVSTAVMLNVAFLGILCSAIGYYIYVYALKNLGVGTATLFLNLVPVVTVVSSYFILKETIDPAQMAGGAMIILSAYLAGWKQAAGCVPCAEEEAKAGTKPV
jgi:drug/metabolite transporter (DMT)-like permease